MDAPQSSRVDTCLKNLKLLSRRLHTLLMTHSTELQILQRLYYKNKNQHRGSLFWRKVVEVRRYSERFEQHKLHILIDNFRCAFYGPSVHNTSSLKGPWTHFPDASYISATSNKIKNSVRLLEKTCQACLNAFMSFHRSMQSAAFLPILLMLIAISSRMRVLYSELQNVLQQVVSNVESLLPTVMVSFSEGSVKDTTAALLESNSLISVYEEHGQHITPSLLAPQQGSPPHIAVESKIHTRIWRDGCKDSSHAKPPSKKKMPKAARNDIDDIFGN